MASNKTLDPLAIQSSAEAFIYPLPQVRQFHRDLTNSLDEQNARLRTLVGGSYRELLGTAEQILQMRKDISGVEEKLGKVGEGCGRGIVMGMVGGMGKLQGHVRDGGKSNEMGRVARSKVLGMCVIVVGKVLRRPRNSLDSEGRSGRGRHLVVAAKVLVLSRLLAKSLEGGANTEYVEETRKKLGALRRKLLRAIERSLAVATTSGGDREDLVQALCAYSLATSSGAKDVLKHFLRIRGEAMTLAFDDEEESKRETSGVLRALELYTRTILDVQALVPRTLGEALAALKTKPLLKDDSIRQLEGLRLDVCEQWFGDEILYFTPYVRHDDLEVSQVVQTLRGWANKASEVLLQGFTKTLQEGGNFKTVVDLRTKILEVWIKDGGKAKGFDPSELLNGLRGVVNNRLVELLEGRVDKLHLVKTEMESTLGAWEEGITDKYAGLWSDDMMEMEISNGASLFKQNILARTYGRNDAVSRVVNSFQAWRHLIDEVSAVIDQLKKQRWDDDLEDIEDDDTLEKRNTLLSKDDPLMLQDHLNSSLETAFADLHTKMTALVEQYGSSQYSGKISMYVLRILRDIRTHLPNNPSIQNFGQSIIPSLHEKLAVTVSEQPMKIFAKAFGKKKVAGRALWEGTPELPVQPSPATFRFLRGLSLAMADAGADLWSPAAVKELKGRLCANIGAQWTAAMSVEKDSESIDKPADETPIDASGETNDTAKSTPIADEIDEEKQKDILKQSLFDIVLLQHALQQANTENQLHALGVTIEDRLRLDASEKKRIMSGAAEYWKRSSLLFSLLA